MIPLSSWMISLLACFNVCCQCHCNMLFCYAVILVIALHICNYLYVCVCVCVWVCGFVSVCVCVCMSGMHILFICFSEPMSRNIWSQINTTFSNMCFPLSAITLENREPLFLWYSHGQGLDRCDKDYALKYKWHVCPTCTTVTCKRNIPSLRPPLQCNFLCYTEYCQFVN